MDIQSFAAIVFILFLTVFLFIKRKNLTIQRIIYPVIYFAMYRTKLGLVGMDRFASRFRRPLYYLCYASIGIGFVGLVFISVTLVQQLLKIFASPEAAAGVALVLPFKVKGSFYVPFFYWIIAIFLIAVVHEFSHGLMARVHNIKIKSSGFAFLGVVLPVVPAAFVEPDEEQIKKESTFKQLSVYSAGPFSNVLFAFVVIGLMALLSPVTGAMYEQNGIEITGYTNESMISPAQEAGIGVGERVLFIDDVDVSDVSAFTEVLGSTAPGTEVEVVTNASTYMVVLGEHPENPGSSYIGAYVKQSSMVKESFLEKYGGWFVASLSWLFGLFYWLVILNLGIGLFNLLPLGPVDGGRMLLAALQKYLPQEKAHKTWKFVSLFFLAVIIINLGVAFIR